jgi:hypothetical protein
MPRTLPEIIMTKSKVLVLGSNGGGTGPTGNYFNETVVPAMTLIEAGYHLVLATPKGTKPHIDEASDRLRRREGISAGGQGLDASSGDKEHARTDSPQMEAREKKSQVV